MKQRGLLAGIAAAAVGALAAWAMVGAGASVSALSPDDTAPPGTISPVEPASEDSEPVSDGLGFLTGPIISPSKPSAAAGERVTLSIDGFNSPWVTVTVCGNEARRGSADCNLTGSVTNEFNDADDAMALSYVITAPPADCPCVLRAIGRDSTEVAVAPFTVTGHPIGPLVDPPIVDDLFVATVVARPRSTGALDAIRAEMGGPATYEVTVRVTNTSTTPLRQLRLSGSVGPSSEESLSSLELDDPGLLGVGQTWEQTVTAVVPAPSFGDFQWQVAVSGAGPTVVATSVTTHRPWLLIVLVLTIVGILFTVALRMLVRRKARAAADAEDRPEVSVVQPGEMPLLDRADRADRAEDVVGAGSAPR